METLWLTKNQKQKQKFKTLKMQERKIIQKMKKYYLSVTLTFLQEILGTQTGDKDIYRSYIGSKAPDATTIEEEVAAVGVDNVVEKGKTWFPKNKDGKRFIYDYQIKGFFKSACQAMKGVEGSLSSKVKAYKKLIDQSIFIRDRENVFFNYKPEEVSEIQRPLRAMTMQGERVSIAISESLPAGTKVCVTILVFTKSHLDLVKEWLDYGQFNGLLQWRNAKFGSFTWEAFRDYEED